MFTIVVPNLDRMMFRWDECVRRLSAQNTPSQRIIRFPAYNHQNYTDFGSAEPDIIRRFGSVPAWLERKHWSRSKSNFCWRWTWYSTLDYIGRFPSGLYLLLVEDCELLLAYKEVDNVLKRLTGAVAHIRAVFLGHLFEPKNWGHRIYPPGFTELEYGLAGEGDFGTVYTPDGARYMMSCANANSECLDPWQLTAPFARRMADDHELRQSSGLFSATRELTKTTGRPGAVACRPIEPDVSTRDEVRINRNPGRGGYIETDIIQWRLVND